MWAADAGGLRNDGASAAAVAGAAEAAIGSAGYPQGRQDNFDMDCAERDHGSADGPEPGPDEDLPRSGTGAVALRNSGGSGARG